MPRSRHGEWSPPADRTDPLEILALQATTRMPDLVPIRYGRMAASPFAFYRGAAAVMASDLACDEHSHLDVQLCGDAHLVNFGGFASPERDMIFDVNDFDETLPGPVRVGPQAPGGQCRGGRPVPGLRRRPAHLAGGASPPAATARRSASSPPCAISTSGISSLDADAMTGAVGRRGRPQGDGELHRPRWRRPRARTT